MDYTTSKVHSCVNVDFELAFITMLSDTAFMHTNDVISPPRHYRITSVQFNIKYNQSYKNLSEKGFH